jgi:hypothetical protein
VGDLLTANEEGRSKIEAVEVWGCGGQDMIEGALLARQKERLRREMSRRKKMDGDQKAELMMNGFAQEMFLSKTFDHKANMSQQGVRDDPTEVKRHI